MSSRKVIDPNILNFQYLIVRGLTMTKLNVTLAQMIVARGNPEANLNKAETLVSEASRRGSNMICFPEMWTTGFDWATNNRIATDQEKVIDRVANMARQYHIWINGSMLALNDEGKVSNTSILFDATGKRAGIYRKAHLFTMFHEDEHMAPGNSLCTVQTPWGMVGLSVCYDIRFPELFRTYALKGVKIQLSPMAFPYPRLQHWKVLVRARAIENQMYMIGTNQVGTEDFGFDGVVTYFGDSSIIDPWGETVIEGGEKEESLLTASIEIDKVDQIRSKMKVLNDRRPDLYEVG
ncbi:MAG TPA: carbon-nitrogen family hydrolase [Candidatus Saccharimonadales bacterium]|nr:carbon-nitrogen family hydrolase [Candidatus Saccharimonadales bacterium]